MATNPYPFSSIVSPFRSMLNSFSTPAIARKPKPLPTLSSNFSTAPPAPTLRSTPVPVYHPPGHIPNAPATPYMAPSLQPPPPRVVSSSAPAPMTSQGQPINPATGGLVPPAPLSSPEAPSVTPTIAPSYYDDITRAERGVTSALPITAEELATQEQLDKLQESTRAGFLTAEGRPIPMELITGEQQGIEKRSLALAEPLNAKMARLQAQRLSALDASKFALERADKRLDLETERNKPVSVTAGTSLVNPKTGATVASGGSLSDKQALDTFYNLTQLYPDARVSWNPTLSPQQNLDAAQKAASTSPSFQAKNTVYAINPLTGQPMIISKMGGGGGSAFGGGGGGAPAGGGVSEANLAPELKSALINIGSTKFFDQSKVTSAQLPYLQRAAQQMGVPLLTKEDANKVQEAFGNFKGANALIEQIVNLSSKVLNASDSAGDQTVQAARLKAIELAPSLSTNNDAKQFISARQSILSLITRAAGEKGVLTNTDVERIANALPSYGDSKTLAAKKAANLSSVLESVFSGAVAAYIGQPAGQSPGGGDAYQAYLKAIGQ